MLCGAWISSVLAFLLCLISALMQHLSSRNEAKLITDLLYGIIHVDLEYVSVSLGWAATGPLALESFGVIWMSPDIIFAQIESEIDPSETEGSEDVATEQEYGDTE
jgi:hypothetical protein